MDIDELYKRHIEPLLRAEQLRLLARLTRDLAKEDHAADAAGAHSLLELEGLGAEIWQEDDAQAYVHALRDAWEPRP